MPGYFCFLRLAACADMCYPAGMIRSFEKEIGGRWPWADLAAGDILVVSGMTDLCSMRAVGDAYAKRHGWKFQYRRTAAARVYEVERVL